MDINLSISAAPAITTNYLVVAIYEASSPTTVVDFQAYAAPHTSPRNISFTNVNPAVHIVKIFENTSGSVGGTIRHQFIYDPSFTNAEIKFDEFIVVGTTAGFDAGNTSFVPSDNRWDGWDYEIEIRQSFGQLQKDVEWNKIISPHFGFEVILDGYTFQDQEVYIIHFYPKISVVTPTSNPGGAKVFDTVMVVTDNISLTNSDMNKAVFIEGENPFLTITLPDIKTVLANRIIPIVSNSGNHINASISAYGWDKIHWLNQELSELILGQSELLWLFKWVNPSDVDDYHWKVINEKSGMRSVGQIVSSYLLPQSVDPVNAIFANGALLSRTTYKRLWNYVQSLDSSAIVSDADWTNFSLNNTGKYSTGDGSTTFRIPRLYDNGYMRGVDNVTRKAGSFQDMAVQPLKATISMGNSFTGNPGGGWSQRPGKGDVNPFDKDYTIVKPDGSPTGTETTPKNTGHYLLILI
jgi:hypothetical protein